jgi:hypothetical protein
MLFECQEFGFEFFFHKKGFLGGYLGGGLIRPGGCFVVVVIGIFYNILWELCFYRFLGGGFQVRDENLKTSLFYDRA